MKYLINRYDGIILNNTVLENKIYEITVLNPVLN